MGAAENEAVVRRGYEAFNSADMDTLTKIFDESAVWHTPGRGILAGDHNGRDATFAYFGRLGGDTKGTFKAILQQIFTASDGRVVGLHRNTGERNGKHLAVDCCLVFEFKDGLITSGSEHFDDLYAWDQFWS